MRGLPKKAGNWLFSTVSVAGFQEPLEIASIPATSRTNQTKVPYLVFYCQKGSIQRLNAFVDWRKEVPYAIKASVKINAIKASSFEPRALVSGDTSRMSLPSTLTPLLREAIQIEVAIAGETTQFLLLHWQETQNRLMRTCAAN